MRDADLRKRILRSLDDVPVPPPDVDEVRRRAGARRGRALQLRRRAAWAVAAAVFIAGVAVPLAAVLWPDTSSQEAERTTTRPPGEPALSPSVGTMVPVGAFPKAVAVGEGGVWVATETDEPGFSLVRIDPDTSEVTETIPLGSGAPDVAAGGGAVWALTNEPPAGWELWRVDPHETSSVEVIPLNCAAKDGCLANQVAVGESGVWVTTEASGAGEVLRVDPSTNAVVARIPVDGRARDIVAGEGSVWVVSLTHLDGSAPGSASVHRIDPQTNEAAATFLPGEHAGAAGVDDPPSLAVGEGMLWAAKVEASESGERQTVGIRIDVQTGDEETFPVEEGFSPFAAEDGVVWVKDGGRAGRSTFISVLDAETLEIGSSIGLDHWPVDVTLDTAADSIWVANLRDSVTRIDLR